YKHIKQLYYQNKVSVNKKAIQAVLEADVVIFAPGSLYTSLIANLLFPEIINAINQTYAKKVLIGNLMTQAETAGYTLDEHIVEVEKVIGRDAIDLVIYNNNFNIPKSILKTYTRDGQELVCPEDLKHKNIGDNFISISADKHIRHNARKLGYKIFSYAFDSLTSEF
ncbi:MAG: 2-phospho-L-lactate transferase CofD family protein, partial [Bacteroidales bacterium]|nr:2-phospho-L-lactate transferase CofD family protein [Bacteroidales bacterium]